MVDHERIDFTKKSRSRYDNVIKFVFYVSKPSDILVFQGVRGLFFVLHFVLHFHEKYDKKAYIFEKYCQK